MAQLTISKLTKEYVKGIKVLNSISCTIEDLYKNLFASYEICQYYIYAYFFLWFLELNDISCGYNSFKG